MKSLTPPRWTNPNDRYKVEVLAETDISKCSLYVEVLEILESGEEVYLGCVEVKDKALKELLCSNKSVAREYAIKAYSPSRLQEIRELTENIPSRESDKEGALHSSAQATRQRAQRASITRRLSSSVSRHGTALGSLILNGGPAGYEVGVLSCRGLQRMDHFVVILWVDNDIGHTAIIADSSSPVFTAEEVFHLNVPLGFRMEECVLELQVWSMMPKEPTRRGDFNGSVRLTGKDLTDFLTGGEPWSTRLEKPLGRTPSLPREVQHDRNIQGGFITVLGGPAGLYEREPKRYELSVLRATGLAKPTNSVVSIILNSESLGKSSVAKKTADPDWSDQKFAVVCQSNQDLAVASSLRIEVNEVTSSGSVSDFLGLVVLTNLEVSNLLCQTYAVTEQFELQRDESKDEKKQKYVKGTVTVRGGPLGARAMDEHTVVIRACKDLLTAASGPPDVYCVVLWNGETVGRTTVKERSTSPFWLDAWFHVRIPPSGLSACRLVVEVWSAPPSTSAKNSASTPSVPTFLGAVTREGLDLAFMEAQAPTDIYDELRANDDNSVKQRGAAIQGSIWYGSPGTAFPSQLLATLAREEALTGQ
eukprot:gene1779-2088_t